MIEILKAILFGIVEGITEWLPISSTGHMIILDEFVKLDCTPEFKEMFLVVIQLGAILAVVLLFWNKIFPFQFKDKSKPVIEMDKIMLWCKIVVACIPAAVIGLLFDDVFEALFYHAFSVAIALIVFGVAFIVIERRNKGKKAKITRLEDITFQTALMIGVFQLIAAIFPGTSRSGATIVGVWSQPIKNFEVWLCILRNGTGNPCSWNTGSFYRICSCDPFPDGLYQETRFPGIWMVSNCSWCTGHYIELVRSHSGIKVKATLKKETKTFTPI